jgi:hypothetical protein
MAKANLHVRLGPQADILLFASARFGPARWRLRVCRRNKGAGVIVDSGFVSPNTMTMFERINGRLQSQSAPYVLA